MLHRYSRLLAVASATSLGFAAAWSSSAANSFRSSPLCATRQIEPSQERLTRSRRSLLESAPAFLSFALLGASAVTPLPCNALVKGNAPPPKASPPGSSSEKKCRNVEECQEQAERLAQKKLEEEMANAVPPKIAPGGSRYKDMVQTDVVEEGVRLAKTGDKVELRYKVLKLGKRSYDGLSGEGTVVFSRGYGLEDDEKKAGDSSFVTTLGSSDLIAAISDGVPGMAPGFIRRISILPQMGWRLPGKACDGGPGGSGAGGELKTDYVVVPTATMVNEEACFDKSKLPFPARYDQQRRLAQRFDQSLIVEIELVGFP